MIQGQLERMATQFGSMDTNFHHILFLYYASAGISEISPEFLTSFREKLNGLSLSERVGWYNYLKIKGKQITIEANEAHDQALFEFGQHSIRAADYFRRNFISVDGKKVI